MSRAIALGCRFTIVATNGTRGSHKTLACGMCSRRWITSRKMLEARMLRWGHLRCPGCGAELAPAGRR